MREEKNLERIREVIAQVVKGSLDKLKVNEVVVVPDYGSIGDPILWVRVIFRGSYKKNEKYFVCPEAMDVVQEIRDRLEGEAISDAYPVITYVPQSEWTALKKEMIDDAA